MLTTSFPQDLRFEVEQGVIQQVVCTTDPVDFAVCTEISTLCCYTRYVFESFSQLLDSEQVRESPNSALVSEVIRAILARL